MKLVSLKLKNFQGIEDGYFEFNGKDAFVHGDNGTGKTTLFNAYTWLLFGRASTEEKGYSPKTLTKDGKPVHRKPNSVVGVFELKDGSTITLEKVYEEIWKRSRNKPEAELGGHKTNHFINGVPTPAKGYKEKIAGMTSQDDEVIKILTMPHYFAGSLNWQTRRSILMDVFGHISDEDVFRKNNKLSELKEYLVNPHNKGQAYSVDEYVRMAKNRISGREGLKARLDELPSIMDELHGLIEDTDTDEKPLVEAIKRLKQELEDLEEGGRANLADLKLAHNREMNWLASMEMTIRSAEKNLAHAKQRLKEASEASGHVCSACGQMLPLGEAERHKKESIKIAEKKVREHERVLRLNLGSVGESKKKIEELEEEIKQAEKESNSDNCLKGALATSAELLVHEGKLAIMRNNAQHAQRQKARLKELAQEQETLSKEHERLLRGLWLCEQFTASKARYLEEAVNSKLSHLKVRFFEKQINGGYAEVCDVLVPTGAGGHVPYQTANTAGKLNAGLELINILSKHWGFSMPVFLDNAEAVTEVIDTGFQLIGLVVSGVHDKLAIHDEMLPYDVRMGLTDLGLYERNKELEKMLGLVQEEGKNE